MNTDSREEINQKVNYMKSKVFSGVVWKLSERILAQVISLVVTIVLARILSPSDFGVVGIVTIFFAYANVIISGGLNTALIQKIDADLVDYSSVFTLSLAISLIIYIILYFIAPGIANLYNHAILTSVIRVLGLSLPIYAVKSILYAYIIANFQFKEFFFATVGGTLISAVVGISMARNGFGVWALVMQQLTNTIVDTIILFAITNIRLSFTISLKRLRKLFYFGSRILISSLINITFVQINPLFIGLKYNSADLSFYTKGKSFPDVLSSSLTYTISSVLFPALSKFQDDKKTLLRYTRLYMRLSSFMVFPMMLGMFAVSDKFVHLLLTDKWYPAIYYMRIACIASMFDVVAAGNCETIKAMGRSDVYLKIEIVKKIGYFSTIILFLIFSSSPEILAISLLVCTVIQVLINSMPNRKLLGYSLKLQVSDLMPNLFFSVVMCICVYFIGRLRINSAFLLIIQIVSGGLIYLVLNAITKNESLRDALSFIRKK